MFYYKNLPLSVLPTHYWWVFWLFPMFCRNSISGAPLRACLPAPFPPSSTPGSRLVPRSKGCHPGCTHPRQPERGLQVSQSRAPSPCSPHRPAHLAAHTPCMYTLTLTLTQQACSSSLTTSTHVPPVDPAPFLLCPRFVRTTEASLEPTPTLPPPLRLPEASAFVLTHRPYPCLLVLLGPRRWNRVPGGSPLRASSQPHDLLLGPSQFQGRRSLARGAPADRQPRESRGLRPLRRHLPAGRPPPQLHLCLVFPGCLPPSLSFLLCPSSRPQTPPLT